MTRSSDGVIAFFMPLICGIYGKYNPAKLTVVEKLLADYAGDAEQLFIDVHEKYLGRHVPCGGQPTE